MFKEPSKSNVRCHLQSYIVSYNFSYFNTFPCLYLIKQKKTEPVGSVFFCLVRKTGLEPVRCKPHAPQTCASASSATSALPFFDDSYIIHFQNVFVNTFLKKTAKILTLFCRCAIIVSAAGRCCALPRRIYEKDLEP